MKWVTALSALVLVQTSILTQSEIPEVVRGIGAALRDGYLYAMLAAGYRTCSIRSLRQGNSRAFAVQRHSATP